MRVKLCMNQTPIQMNIKKEKKQMLTAAERRFAKEVARMINMPLSELLTVENSRMSVGV